MTSFLCLKDSEGCSGQCYHCAYVNVFVVHDAGKIISESFLNIDLTVITIPDHLHKLVRSMFPWQHLTLFLLLNIQLHAGKTQSTTL